VLEVETNFHTPCFVETFYGTGNNQSYKQKILNIFKSACLFSKLM